MLNAEGKLDMSYRLDTLTKVSWVDSRDPQNKLVSLFNPEEFTLSTRASIGKLYPVGWSQPVQQYAHTEAMSYSLTLPFSIRAYQDKGIPYTDFQDAHRFFRSFLYGEYAGVAPSYLKMIWPRTAIIMNVVEGVDVNFQAWDVTMHVTRYTVTLNLVEIRAAYLQKVDVLVGSSLLFPDGTLGEVEGDATGKPLRMTGQTAVGKGGVKSSG
jgi:hypothetical protein